MSITKHLLLFAIFGLYLNGCNESAKDQCLGQGGAWDEANQHCIQQDQSVNLHEQDSTRFYTYDIKYPAIIKSDQQIRKLTKDYAHSYKQEFIGYIDTTLAKRTPPWDFQLQYLIHDSTEYFLSIKGNGYTYMGGAHGNPFFKTFNIDQKQNQVVQLKDMFPDSTGLQPISKYVRQRLADQLIEGRFDHFSDKEDITRREKESMEWIEEGTVPDFDNYSSFLFSKPVDGKPSGIVFIFPPYQVAAYVMGPQEVFVPASIFKEELNDKYRNWFTVL